jgi:hypothetical protein
MVMGCSVLLSSPFKEYYSMRWLQDQILPWKKDDEGYERDGSLVKVGKKRGFGI